MNKSFETKIMDDEDLERKSIYERTNLLFQKSNTICTTVNKWTTFKHEEQSSRVIEDNKFRITQAIRVIRVLNINRKIGTFS